MGPKKPSSIPTFYMFFYKEPRSRPSSKSTLNRGVDKGNFWGCQPKFADKEDFPYTKFADKEGFPLI